MAEFDELRTLDDVRRYIAVGYHAAMGSPQHAPLEFSIEYGRLPLAVAQPGPLIEHCVRIAGDDGLTLQQLRDVFFRLGKERLEEGISFARSAGLVHEAREKRPNRAGRLQQQVVLYPGGDA